MEELCAELYTQEKIRGFLHLYTGEEAVATGVFNFIHNEDNVVATYREHGHAYLKGISARQIIAEMYGKQEGCCKGHGGSMHLFSEANRFYGGQAIVAGGLPLAVGLALSSKMQNEERLTYCFFGDGATAEGEFHESMNLASLWDLPLIFCCENNLYAMGTAIARYSAQTDLIKKSESYKILAKSVDGMDIYDVIEKTQEAVAYVKKEKKPVFLEFKTYRFRPHSMFDPDLYRQKSEVSEWKKKCCIAFFKKSLLEKKIINLENIMAIEDKVETELQDAISFAESGSFEAVTSLLNDVYAGGGL
jgi:pyruvate dehydrogenase E1 component alpha subunit